jgi:hypothetical protein
MPPKKPLLLVDNVFDTVTQYPFATLSASSERTGHEAFRVADYRRERTSWQTTGAAAGHYVASDLGVGASHAADFLWIDRGHNLWGKTVQITGDNGSGGGSNGFSSVVPAAGTLGGDPAAGFAVTEEGALYTLHPGLQFGAKRRWIFIVQESMSPIVPGIMLGLRSQLLTFSTTFDEDARDRTQDSATSRAGYKATDTTYAWRTCEIGLATIGAEQYDAQIRALSVLLFDRNQPCVIAMDHGTYPERAWLFQYDGPSWHLPKTRVYRSGRMLFREVGPSVG